MNDETPANFLAEIIEKDLADGTHDHVVVRFPPEPNGYLHIGHAKSITVNFSLAERFGGRCHLRFDDTNPEKESTEYVEAIQRDVKWLGFDWGEHLYFASDYFDRFHELAVGLIEDGKAYVCELSEEDFRAIRGTVTEPGSHSPYRTRSVQDNLERFRAMAAGELAEGSAVLRAKGDMASPNMKLRDPPLYRIKKVHHHRTGDKWCIYPMYDYAHPLEDAIEGVTHSFCTLEFDNNRAIYDWVIDNTQVTTRPRQYEFARLALAYTVMSKRKLLQLVDDGLVDGWDDPRMPTVSGLRRKGVPPLAIRRFAERVGLAKVNSLVDPALFEHVIRDTLEESCPRAMGVLRPLEVIVDNLGEDEVIWLDIPKYPEQDDSETRRVPFTRRLYLEQEDFALDPPKKWRRLAPGWEVRLRYAFFLRCDSVEQDADGNVVRLHCTYDPETRGGAAPDSRKPKGTLHWVSASHGVPATVHLYDHLFAVERPDEHPEGYLAVLNPEGRVTVQATVEPSLVDDPADTRWQLERVGFFWRDPSHTGEGLVLGRIVALKSGYKIAAEAPKSQKQAPPAKKNPKGKKQQRVLPELDPAGAARAAALEALGIAHADAVLIAADAELDALMGRASTGAPASVAKLLLNDIQALRKEHTLAELPFGGAEVGQLAELLDSGRISSRIGKDVLAVLVTDGGTPGAIIAERGWEVVSDPAALRAIADAVLAAHPDEVAAFRGGNQRLMGFFIGKAMQASGGTADPKGLQQAVRKALTEG